jgi:uncharacterized protein YukE
MNYSPLADGDPFPGDTSVLSDLVLRLSQFHQALSDSASQVGGAISESWVGDAADAFRSRQAEIPPKLHGAADRMARLDGALRPFLHQLETIQDQGNGLASAARGVADQLHSISYGVSQQRAFLHQQAILQAAGKPFQPWMGPPYIEEQRHLHQQFQGLQQRFSSLENEYSMIVGRCAGALDQAKNDGLQNTSLSVFEYECNQVGGVIVRGAEGVWHAVDSNLKEISKILGKISDLIGLAQIVVVVIAVVAAIAVVAIGQPELLIVVAAAYEATTRVLSAASLEVDSLKAAADTRLAATGRGSWSDVAADAVSVGSDVAGILSGSPAKNLEGDLTDLSKCAGVKSEIKVVEKLASGGGSSVIMVSQKIEKIVEPDIVAAGKFVWDHAGKDYVIDQARDSAIKFTFDHANDLANALKSSVSVPSILSFPGITVALPTGGVLFTGEASNG